MYNKRLISRYTHNYCDDCKKTSPTLDSEDIFKANSIGKQWTIPYATFYL